MLNRDIDQLRNANGQLSSQCASLRAGFQTLLSPNQPELAERMLALEQTYERAGITLHNTLQELSVEKDNVKRVEGWLAYEKRACQNEMKAHSHTQAINMELVHYLNRLPLSAHPEGSSIGTMQSEIAHLKLETNNRYQDNFRQQEQLSQCMSDNAELRAAFNARDAEVITRRVESEMLRTETEELKRLCDVRAREIAQHRTENERLKAEIDAIGDYSSMESFVIESASTDSDSDEVMPIDSDPDFTIDDDEILELTSS